MSLTEGKCARAVAIRDNDTLIVIRNKKKRRRDEMENVSNSNTASYKYEIITGAWIIVGMQGFFIPRDPVSLSNILQVTFTRMNVNPK